MFEGLLGAAMKAGRMSGARQDWDSHLPRLMTLYNNFKTTKFKAGDVIIRKEGAGVRSPIAVVVDVIDKPEWTYKDTSSHASYIDIIVGVLTDSTPGEPGEFVTFPGTSLNFRKATKKDIERLTKEAEEQDKAKAKAEKCDSSEATDSFTKEHGGCGECEACRAMDSVMEAEAE